MNRRIDLIPVPCALGAPDGGVAGGPAALRDAGLQGALQRGGHAADWQLPVMPDLRLPRLDALVGLCTQLAERTAASLLAGRQPWIVGGDHAIATGTWQGVARATAQPVGLLWIDAHLDAHVPDDSPSGNPHGMPLACLLGAGAPALANGALVARHVCVLGARDWEGDEMARLRRFGVRVIDAAEITQRGLPEALRVALKIVTAAPGGFGLTFDLDVFDPAEAPGVNSPARGGQPAADWLAALHGLAARRDCLAVEIVECDPTRDNAERTAQLAVRLAGVLSATGSVTRRPSIPRAGSRPEFRASFLPRFQSARDKCPVWASRPHGRR